MINSLNSRCILCQNQSLKAQLCFLSRLAHYSLGLFSINSDPLKSRCVRLSRKIPRCIFCQDKPPKCIFYPHEPCDKDTRTNGQGKKHGVRCIVCRSRQDRLTKPAGQYGVNCKCRQQNCGADLCKQLKYRVRVTHIYGTIAWRVFHPYNTTQIQSDASYLIVMHLCGKRVGWIQTKCIAFYWFDTIYLPNARIGNSLIEI